MSNKAIQEVTVNKKPLICNYCKEHFGHGVFFHNDGSCPYILKFLLEPERQSPLSVQDLRLRPKSVHVAQVGTSESHYNIIANIE